MDSYKTVVQGEASESEDDEELEIDDKPNAVVVAGEASESEEEELDTSLSTSRKDIPPLKLSEHSISFESIDDISSVPTLTLKQAGRPKYD
ncbi:unnamed protein product, partial [Lymnaea stagnalis]